MGAQWLLSHDHETHLLAEAAVAGEYSLPEPADSELFRDAAAGAELSLPPGQGDCGAGVGAPLVGAPGCQFGPPGLPLPIWHLQHLSSAGRHTGAAALHTTRSTALIVLLVKVTVLEAGVLHGRAATIVWPSHFHGPC